MTKKIRKQKGTFGNSTHESRNKETQLKDWKISYEMAENEQKGKEIEFFFFFLMHEAGHSKLVPWDNPE